MRQRGVPGRPPRGGYPVRYPPRGGTWSGNPPGGVPSQVPPRGTRTPRGDPGGGGTQTPPGGGGGTRSGPPRGGGGVYPGRTTEGVLTTRRAVCLLRSRRRTFLLVRKMWRRSKTKIRIQLSHWHLHIVLHASYFSRHLSFLWSHWNPFLFYFESWCLFWVWNPALFTVRHEFSQIPVRLRHVPTSSLSFKVCLHRASASKKSQCCDKASDTALK